MVIATLPDRIVVQLTGTWALSLARS
jgi:hypothetical protein